jgi:ATP-dependent DNA helicase RecG
VRPVPLFPLFAEVTALAGVGKQTAALIERLVGRSVVDLLWHLPVGLIDRQPLASLAEARVGAVGTVKITVLSHLPPQTARRPYRVLCTDGVESLSLLFFHARGDWLVKQLPEGAQRLVSGRFELFGETLQISHPDYIMPVEEANSVPSIEPVYPLTAGLPSKTLAKAVKAALDRIPSLPEWLDPLLIEREGWSDWETALRAAHAPTHGGDLDPGSAARRRLAFDELLANQLALGLVRAHQRKRRGRELTTDGPLRRSLLVSLPYKLTGAQTRAIKEIDEDLASPRPMLRLLQGDVGSGKTVVALACLIAAVDSGAQAALMAPTEILARQHFATLSPLVSALGLRVTLLAGAARSKLRQESLALLATGEADIAIGTHALFQEDVVFRDLGVAVIDEQHRFGVHQRLALASKGKGVDVLVMTATPIPRTLTLTAYGDLDVSRLDEKPPGRKPIGTRALPLDRLEDVIAGVGRAIGSGAKVYWICPLVEESEQLDLAAAVERHAALQGYFGNRVGLVHGKMKLAEREMAMDRFANPESVAPTDILVATTVIEVGVDVPQASVIVIEHAERFGLAQLHQLRGRVGRGDRASSCLMLYQTPLTETAKARLNILRETEDGFRIAEEDLALRGAGEMLGVKQSGMPSFRLADLSVHDDLLSVARADSQRILRVDPEMADDRGRALRLLLHLFERDAAARFLRSG